MGKEAEREYWATLLPDAVAAHERELEAARNPEALAPRRRKVTTELLQKSHTKDILMV